MDLEEDQKHPESGKTKCSRLVLPDSSAFRIVEYTNYPCDEGLFVLIFSGQKIFFTKSFISV